MNNDKSDLQELKAFFERSGGSDESNRIALTAIWTQDELPDIENDAQCESYKRLQSELEEKAPPKQTMERSKWHHSDQGILWGAYAVKIHQWEEQQAGKLRTRRR